MLHLLEPSALWLMDGIVDTNLLPVDGEVYYYGPILAPNTAEDFFHQLLSNVPWKHDELVIFGKRVVTGRQVAWYGDPGCVYAYSGKTKAPLPWTTELLALKALTEKATGGNFNSCLLNLYADGTQGMSWHSDDEKELGENPTIASLSLGADRKFCFKHKGTRQTISLVLQHGSLLVMQGATQRHWLHSLPKSKKTTASRINLTFRTIVR